MRRFLNAKHEEVLVVWVVVAIPMTIAGHLIVTTLWRIAHGCWLWRSYLLGRYVESCGQGVALPWLLGTMAGAMLLSAGLTARWMARPDASP